MLFMINKIIFSLKVKSCVFKYIINISMYPSHKTFTAYNCINLCQCLWQNLSSPICNIYHLLSETDWGSLYWWLQNINMKNSKKTWNCQLIYHCNVIKSIHSLHNLVYVLSNKIRLKRSGHIVVDFIIVERK